MGCADGGRDRVPQPYDQLAATYRSAGREDAARLVAIAQQRHRRQALNPAGKLVNWLLYLTVGYGYRTWLANAAWANQMAWTTRLASSAVSGDAGSS